MLVVQLPGVGRGGRLPGKDKEAEIQEIKQNPPSGMEHVILWSDQPQMG